MGNITRKIGNAVSKEMIGEYAMATIGSIVYTVVPTALNLNGWTGFAVAMAPLAVFGIIFESPALLAGGLFVALVHFIYRWGSDLTMRWWGRPIWSLDAVAAQRPGVLNDYVRYPTLNDHVQLPNGYSALALPPADQPSAAQVAPAQLGPSMNDYVMHGDQTLMDGGDADMGFLASQRYEQDGGSYDAPSIFD